MTTDPAVQAACGLVSETPDKPHGTLRGLATVVVTLGVCALL